MPKILQVVPRLPPYTDGVGDYGLRIFKSLSQYSDLSLEFLVIRPDQKSEDWVDGFRSYRLPNASQEAFLSLVPDDVDVILLQYSNYPYLLGKFDAPYWLLDALKALKKNRQIKLVVMFHELPTIRLGSMSFINPVQGFFSCKLSSLADTVITNTADFKRFLSIWSSRIYCIPNFSTIGEPKYIPTLQDRNRDLVIFGSADRNRVYQKGMSNLIKLCERLGIERILDIGQRTQIDLSPLEEKVPVVRMGRQPAEVISQIMTDSVAGLFDYGRFPRHLGKSSVYAAYCAHGLLPIGNGYYPSEADHVFENKQYLVLSKMARDADTAPDWGLYQTVANAAHDWYDNHTLTKCAALFKAGIEQ